MNKPFFSVVIPSRNRPHLLREAIASVVKQSFKDFEIVIVNDGSDKEYEPDFDAILKKHKESIQVINLVRYHRGHGQSYAINTGVFNSAGKYCTFLDDDDFWVDGQHLEKVYRALGRFPEIDAYYTNQVAVSEGEKKGEILWLGDVEKICQSLRLVREEGVYRVTVDILMRSRGFGHLNTSVLSRELFDRVGGLDEDIRWECDRDFFLRSIEQAHSIVFNPDVVSQHHVPDKAKKSNMTTAISIYQRLNYQIYVLNKAAMLSQHPSIIKHVRAHKVYSIQKVSECLLEEGRLHDSFYFARQALCMSLSWRWPLFCLRLLFRIILSKSKS